MKQDEQAVARSIPPVSKGDDDSLSWVLVYGDLFNGFYIFGPFETEDDAILCAEKSNDQEEPWIVMPMSPGRMINGAKGLH